MRRNLLMALVAVLFLVGGAGSAGALGKNEIQAIYNQWLADFANHQPEAAIDMTAHDFIMVNNTTLMDRDQALTFVQQLAQFIVSRQCTNVAIATQKLPDDARSLLSRVDCTFQTVSGPLDAHFLETIIADKRGKIVYDAFSDLAPSSL